MKLVTTWHGKLRFEHSDGEHTVVSDSPAPTGEGKAMSPKRMVLAAICGCTGVDVAMRMRKKKQDLKTFYIEAEAPKREGKPATFDSVKLDFFFEGVVEASVAIEAVVASQTEECGVSAMIAAHCPIHYRVHLNGDLIKEGTANFQR